MSDLLKYFRGYRKEAFLAPLFKLLEAGFELAVPLLIAHIVDHILPKKDLAALYGMVFLLIVLAGFGVIVAIIAQYYSSKAAIGFTQQLTDALCQKMLKLPKSSRDELTIPSLITRITSDTYQIQVGINLFLRLFLRAPIIVFGSIIMAFTINSSLALLFLLMLGILVFINYFISWLINPFYKKIRSLTDKIVTSIRQQLEGTRVIRAFGQVQTELHEFSMINQDYQTWQIRVGKIANLLQPLTFLVVNGILLLLIWNGYQLIGNNLLSQGMLVALVNYLLQILVELLKLTMLITSLNQAYISTKRVTEVFSQEEEDILKALPKAVALPNQSLSLRKVQFTYPKAAEPSLENISFDLLEKQTLGVIGGTGSGKTSLVQLLVSIYPITDGTLSIFKEGESPKNLKEWRSWVSVVPQKAELFQGTVRFNLTLGLENPVTDKELWKALDIAQASEFIEKREGQLESVVAAFGNNFSGGQRQRLTIARAVLRNSPFLILDDATSALDYITEANLLKAIKNELEQTNLILVSQRTDSLRSMDQILLLDKGKQMGFGTHEELLETNPLYQEIYSSQHNSQEREDENETT